MNGPRRVISLEDERGHKTITVNMAYGLSVKWAVQPNGETIFYIDREGESSSGSQSANASAKWGGIVGDASQTQAQAHPQQVQTKPDNGQPEATIKRRRGRPRTRPIIEPMPASLADFKEGLEPIRK